MGYFFSRQWLDRMTAAAGRVNDHRDKHRAIPGITDSLAGVSRLWKKPTPEAAG
jgi:hypothetical protein